MPDQLHISIEDDEQTVHHSTMLPAGERNTNQPEKESPISPDSDVAAAKRAPLPPFMRDDPDIWFFIVEAEFQETNTKSDQIRYSETLRALDKETIRHITDLLRNPPKDNKYATLKKIILS